VADGDLRIVYGEELWHLVPDPERCPNTTHCFTCVEGCSSHQNFAIKDPEHQEIQEKRYMTPKPLDTECPCLNWKKTYEAQKVTCGEGYEMENFFPFFASLLGDFIAWWNNEVKEEEIRLEDKEEQSCSKGFHKLDTTKCMRLHRDILSWQDVADFQSWCYVSKWCSQKESTIETGPWPWSPRRDVDVKYCHPQVFKEDKNLANYTPGELLEAASQWRDEDGPIDLGWLMYRTYTVFPKPRWALIGPRILSMQWIAGDEIYDRAVRERMPFIIPQTESGDPILTTANLWIVYGRQLWHLWEDQDQEKCPNTSHCIECVRSCEGHVL